MLNPTELLQMLTKSGGSIVMEPATPENPIPMLVLRLPVTPDTVQLMTELASASGSGTPG